MPFYTTGPAMLVVGVTNITQVAIVPPPPNTARLGIAGHGITIGQRFAIPGGPGDPSYEMLRPPVPLDGFFDVIGEPMVIQVTDIDGDDGIAAFIVIDPGNYTVPPEQTDTGSPCVPMAILPFSIGVLPTFFVTTPSPFIKDTGVTPALLGTFEDPPEIICDPVVVPLESDEGGGEEIATDRIYVGKEATIRGVLNWFDLGLMLQLMNTANSPHSFNRQFPIDPNETEGWDTESTIGTILGREGATFPIWVLFPRSLSPSMRAKGMIAGYHFLSAFLLKPSTIPTTGEMKMPVIFQCQRKRVVTSSPAKIVGPNTAAIAGTGTGFSVGDRVAIPGGVGDPSQPMFAGAYGDRAVIRGTPMIVQVSSVDGFGGIIGFAIVTPGNYLVPPGNPATGIPVSGNGNQTISGLPTFSLTIRPVVLSRRQTVRYVLYDHNGINGGSMSDLLTQIRLLT